MDANARLDKYLPKILKLLECKEKQCDEVWDFFIHLCNVFPEYEKSYKDAHNISSLRKKLSKAADHAAALGGLLSDPLIRGTLQMEALKASQARGESGVHAFVGTFKLEDSVKTLGNLLQASTSATPNHGAGNNKKLGTMTPKRWVIVLCADMFERYRSEEVTVTNTDFQTLVDCAWSVVSGNDEQLTTAIKDAMPEIREWADAMKAVRLKSF